MTAATTHRTATEALGLVGTRPIIMGGFALGVLFGFGGNFVEAGNVQDVMFGVSALGLITASVLLTMEHGLAGHRFAAAGFALLALGETRVLNPTDVPGAEAGFAAGVLLYAPGLLLIALSTWPPRWVRLLGAVAAIPFAAHGLAFLGGAAVDYKGPLAAVGYTLYTVTVIGWMVTVWQSRPDASGTTAAGRS